MTSLHDKIMNLPLGKGAQNWKADTLLFPYKCGHGDGINQAADLALQADALAEAASACWTPSMAMTSWSVWMRSQQ